MNLLRSTGFRVALKWVFTALIVAAVLLVVDIEKLLVEIIRIPSSAIVIGLALGIIQVFLSAWRWRFTADLLGLPIPYTQAVREYYLATFANQVLPGGVLGDVNRALRHAADTNNRRAAAHGVAIERLSGQFVLASVVATGISWLFFTGRMLSSNTPELGSLAHLYWLLAGIGVAGGLLWVFARKRVQVRGYFSALRGDLARAFFSWPAFPIQVVTSLLVVASYLAVFLVLAAGMGYLIDLPSVAVVAALCSLLLLSMVVPTTVSGWGVREGAAAILWPLAGLPAEQGVALSVGYGALIFFSSLPGLLFLFSSQVRQR
ncbi:lysylphosphatidylglycerol synthase transmembrane domain-containing protein [Marinobacter sp. S6332]|uniref:lysylphosphatidylglycerol synthase transmembrane domain-containing protein n=1 Tax=Marinobacter sp. S6332 TaxID=2926403 RepID=UPI001FF513E2|nr:lysylphosphatidylglycerol synthase transmembrane domain-containing protein [Marinobacter sp. S6332]MCK0163959.1 flippase-like domain-containing protein [Marinobacter sp. S6332]